MFYVLSIAELTLGEDLNQVKKFEGNLREKRFIKREERRMTHFSNKISRKKEIIVSAVMK